MSKPIIAAFANATLRVDKIIPRESSIKIGDSSITHKIQFFAHNIRFMVDINNDELEDLIINLEVFNKKLNTQYNKAVKEQEEIDKRSTDNLCP